MDIDSDTPTAAGLETLAVDAAGAARMCGVSRAMWWKLHSSGRCPAPIRLGRRCLWRVDELRQWLADGCPPRDRWKAERWRKEQTTELEALKARTVG
jgi:predicted DNA-binding transcriptional regulator AlpA